MRGFLKIIPLFFIMFLLFGVRACASSSADELFSDFKDIIPEQNEGIVDGDNLLAEAGIDSIFKEIILAFDEGRGEFLSFFALLFGVCLLISVTECAPLCDTGSLGKSIGAGVITLSGLLVFSALKSICIQISSAIGEMGAFFSSLMPVLTGISVAGGNVTTAGVEAFNMNLTLSIVGRVGTEFLLPLSFTLFVLALADGLGSGALSSVAKGIKSLFMWVLGIGTTVIIGGVSMQSLVASTSDSAYLKAARYAASGMIPIVGSTVSSALSTLIGGLSYVQSTVGAASVIIIVSGAVAPLLLLLIRRAALSICITVMDFIGASGGVRSFSAFRAALDTVIAVYVLSNLVFVLEILIFMKSGVTVLV